MTRLTGRLSSFHKLLGVNSLDGQLDTIQARLSGQVPLPESIELVLHFRAICLDFRHKRK